MIGMTTVSMIAVAGEVVRDDTGTYSGQFRLIWGSGFRNVENGSPVLGKVDVKIHRTIENDGQMWKVADEFYPFGPLFIFRINLKERSCNS